MATETMFCLPVVDEDEEDVFQCGRCKQQFAILHQFVDHKKVCPIKSHVVTGSSAETQDSRHNSGRTMTRTLTRGAPVAPPAATTTSASPPPASPSPHLLLDPPSASLPSNVITLSESDILSLTGNMSTTSGISGLHLNDNSDPLGSDPISILSESGTGASGHPLHPNGLDAVSQAIGFPLSFVASNCLTGTTTFFVTTAPSSNPNDPEGDANVNGNTTILHNMSPVENGAPADVRQDQEKEDNELASETIVTRKAAAVTVEEESAGKRTGSKLQCTFCDRCFNKNFDLQQHIRCHTGEKPFQCVVCGRAFAQKSNVKKHMQTHKVWPDGLAHTLSIGGQENDRTGETGGGHNNNHNHKGQERDGHGVQPDNGGNGMIIEKPEYTCPYCKSSCKTYFELKTHMKNHKREKVYKCIQSTCGCMFSELDSFLQHIQVHDQEITYRCHQCSKSFASLDDLASHQHGHSLHPSSHNGGNNSNGNNKSRSGQRYYRCQKCLNKYTTPAALEHHLTTSTHHYPCPQCNKVFPCERYLRRHLITHGSGLHECHYCDKTFKTANYLKVHLVIHTGVKPYICNICPAAFNRRDKLKRHKLVHDPVKRFKCPFRSHTGCVKEFNRPDKLKAHMLTHSGIRPHQCPQCGRSFSRRAHLRAHVASHSAPGHSGPTSRDQQQQQQSTTPDHEKSDSDDHVVDELDEAMGGMRTEGEIITLFDCCFCGNLFTSEHDSKHHNCCHNSRQRQQLQHHQQQEKQIATPPKKKASLIHAKNLEEERNQRQAAEEDVMQKCMQETGITIDTSSRSSSGIPLNHLSPTAFDKLTP